MSNKGFFTESLASRDPELYATVTGELGRQRDEIELIASENIVSAAVMEAQGTVLTNKYAEGYAGRRYYGGCQFVDVAETLAIDRAKELFGCEFANVQPNSGSQANQGVFQALLQPGDTILGMSLDAGGHLTHGAAPNQSGKWFNAVQYGVRKQDNLLDYDQVEALAKEHQPKMIIAGGSAIPRQIDFKRMREIADMVGAYLHVDMAHFAGLVAAGFYPNPVPHADYVTTTTHKTLRGPRGGMILTNDEAMAKKFNSAIFPGIQGGPLMHVIAGKAVAFGEALRPEFKSYQKQVVANVQPNRPRVDAVLNRKLKIAGDVYFSGILHVECTIEGDLISDDDGGTLILSDAGHIKGSVKASNVMVNGRIDGNVLANNKVELYEKSRINGDLHYNLLEMAVGAGVNGKLVHHELASHVQAAVDSADVSDAEVKVSVK